MKGLIFTCFNPTRGACQAFLLSITVLSACTHNKDQSSQDDYLEIISFRSIPDGSAELKDECACLRTDIQRIAGFTENMKYSQYSMFYLAMGREKMAALQYHADAIGCVVESD